MCNEIIGRRVADFRRLNNITITELAKKTNLSSALISQLERGIGNPTIAALESLADAMSISVSALVAPQTENSSLILRAVDRPIAVDNDHIVIRNILAENISNTSLTVLQLELKPYSQSGEPEQHLEEECLYVTSGEITMVFPDSNESFCLHEGDSVRVLPNIRHVIRNDTNEVAVAINVKCKNKY